MTISSRFDGTCARCSQRFPAGTSIQWRRGFPTTHTVCPPRQQTPPPPQQERPVIAVGGLFAFLQGALDKGLKQPKLRVLAADGKSELRISWARKLKGALAVVSGESFLGYLGPDGKVLGHKLVADKAQQDVLVQVASDPQAQVKRFAVATCRCSFCSLPLTDAGSVEAGYGPVCADHWGLPHTAKGTPQVVPVQ